MSGHQFVETLSQLGYPGVNKLDAQGLDWLFEGDMAPFLDWFCNSVQPSNVLTDDELEQFSYLQDSGESLLDGEQLELMLSTNTCKDDLTPPTKTSLKNDISQMTEDIKTYQLRKETLIKQRDLLSGHLTELSQDASRTENAGNGSKQEYREALDQTQTDNSTRCQSEGGLVKCVNTISGLYEKPGTFTQKQLQDAVFLSQIDLAPLQKMEEKFKQEVTNYSKKQFFEGIAEMTGQTEGSRYDILEISDPKSLLVRGENSDRNLKYSKELARLKNVYPHSEHLRIESNVEKCRRKSANEEAESILRSLQSQPMTGTVASLRGQLEYLQSSCQNVKRYISDETEDVIPNYIQQNTASQVLPIITGDYNLKIARQDYLTSNQDKLIEFLVIQRARNEFLSMSYEVESRNHRDVQRLLTALLTQLQAQESYLQDRLTLMDDPALTPAKYQRGTIDSRDHSTQRLHEILVPPSDHSHHLYQKFSSLIEGANHLYDQRNSTQSTLTNILNQHEYHLNKLQKLLSHCERKVYSESSTSTGQPELTPQPILNAHSSLQRLLTPLEQTLVDVFKEVDQKKRVLKNDPFIRTEREIFEMFIISPDKLGSILEQMKERIRTQMIK